MRFLSALAVCLLCFTASAHATVSVYTNPEFQYTFSYPDSWMPQTEPGGLPHVYKIVAREGRGSGWCAITSDRDRRFVIYPAKYQADLMQREFGPEFWMGWLSEDTEVKYFNVSERTGLGAGQSTTLFADYTRPDFKQERALISGTIHNGVKYVAQCASAPWDFAKYEKTFHSILATLKLQPAFTPFPQGYYRDFTTDRPIVFPTGHGIGSPAF